MQQVEDASKRHQHLDLTERNELDEALNHYDSPSLDSIRAALRAGIKRPLATPRKVLQKAGLLADLHRASSKMGDEATSAVTEFCESLACGCRSQPRVAKRVSGVGSYDALPFDPESKPGIVIIALILVGLTALVYYLLNQLNEAAERFFNDGPPQDIPFGAELRSLIRESKFLETPISTWVTEMLPLAYVSILPLLLGLQAALGCGGGRVDIDMFNAPRSKRPRTGQRVLRRILLGNRAIKLLQERKSLPAALCPIIALLGGVAALAFAVTRNKLQFLGMAPTTFLVEILPLVYVSLFPLLLGLRAGLGLLIRNRFGTHVEQHDAVLRGSVKPRAGQRVLRRVHLGLRAISAIQTSGFSMRLAREEEEGMRRARLSMGPTSA